MTCRTCGNFVRHTDETGRRCLNCWMESKRDGYLLAAAICVFAALAIGLTCGRTITLNGMKRSGYAKVR